MQTRTVVIPSVMLAIAVALCAGQLAAQPVEASRGRDVANEVYAPSLTPGIYLVNFVFLYMANPDLAAYLPAYKAPIPQPVVDCLEQNPTGCPYADYRNTSMSRFSTTGNASGRRCVRRTQDGRAWRLAKLDSLKRSTSHWGGRGPIKSLTSLAWTQA